MLNNEALRRYSAHGWCDDDDPPSHRNLGGPLLISPLLIPSLGLPPISSSYTLHSFTSPGPSTRSFPSISTFVFPLATSVLFHLSSLVALPLPSRIFHPYPQVHVHVRVRVLILCARGSLIPLPLYLPHQLLDSPSASYPRPLRFVVFHRAPAKRLFSRSSARHSPDIPVAASTSFDHIFCIGNGKENKTPGTCSRRLWMAFSSSRDTHTHTILKLKTKPVRDRSSSSNIFFPPFPQRYVSLWLVFQKKFISSRDEKNSIACCYWIYHSPASGIFSSRRSYTKDIYFKRFFLYRYYYYDKFQLAGSCCKGEHTSTSSG